MWVSTVLSKKQLSLWFQGNRLGPNFRNDRGIISCFHIFVHVYSQKLSSDRTGDPHKETSCPQVLEGQPGAKSIFGGVAGSSSVLTGCPLKLSSDRTGDPHTQTPCPQVLEGQPAAKLIFRGVAGCSSELTGCPLKTLSSDRAGDPHKETPRPQGMQG
jgi:hypothetical protein